MNPLIPRKRNSDNMEDAMPTVYLVIPCYNEEAVLPETVKRLTAKMKNMIAHGRADEKSRMLLVDDGSKDKTWRMISDYSDENELVSGIKLAHNRGHQNALLAGLMTAKEYCDCAISLDADLQDDIEVLDQFVDRFTDGCDVVYGVRNKRETDSFFKRTTAQGFYKFMQVLGVDLVYNHADYRLMSRRALDALSEYQEVNLFLRGIVPLIGYRSDTVYYDRHERFAGESKYPLKKMISFAVDGITSFSVKPLKLISNFGILVSVLSVVGLIYALVSYFTGSAVAGWTAIVSSIWLLGGIQLLCIGVLGGYIGKIYSEVKARPRYRIEEFKK
jgi:glycosyltransferase involved in cell wall biosynthesis